MDKVILMSFDLEEFDIPEEYGQTLDKVTQFMISRQGVEALLEVLDRLQIRVTFFITANFALHHPALIHRIAQDHEVASHGFYHSQFELTDLEKSRITLSEICGNSIRGFRMARLQPIDDEAIQKAGYQYNSSMNPTYLPGRYNNFFQPRVSYWSNQLLNIPTSVTPGIRFPLFWLSFKNLPLWLYQLLSRWTLNCDRYLCLYFHPWEFANLDPFTLPRYVKFPHSRNMLKKLENYLIWLQKRSRFITYTEFLDLAKP